MVVGIREGIAPSRFTVDVLRERARLALADPVGELEARRPLDRDQAMRLFHDHRPLARRMAAEGPTVHQDDSGLAAALGVPLSGQGRIPCPSHGSRGATLSWRWDGPRLMVKCFAGCTFGDVVASLRP